MHYNIATICNGGIAIKIHSANEKVYSSVHLKLLQFKIFNLAARRALSGLFPTYERDRMGRHLFVMWLLQFWTKARTKTTSLGNWGYLKLMNTARIVEDVRILYVDVPYSY